MSQFDTKYAACDFIETYTGRTYHPMKPSTDEINIIDIAHHLSLQCRFTGAVQKFYSTAQHCCLLHDFAQRRGANPQDRLQILTHDAGEAYVLDVPRPIKQFVPDYRVMEHSAHATVRKWIGLAEVAVPTWQDEIDSRIVVDERAQLLCETTNDWKHDLKPLGIEIHPWSPAIAEVQFLSRYAVVMHELTGKHAYLRGEWGLPLASFYSKPLDFTSGDTDLNPKGASHVTDLIEVDLLGGVGRVIVRDGRGMMERDRTAGQFPRPKWKFMHGRFDLETPEINNFAPRIEAAS